MSMNGKILKEMGLPESQRSANIFSMEIMQETSYDLLKRYIASNEPKLTYDQRLVYDTIMARMKNKVGRIINIDAPGGTGKMFAINLLSWLKCEKCPKLHLQ